MFNVLLAGFPKRPALLAAARRAPALAPQQVRLPPFGPFFYYYFCLAPQQVRLPPAIAFGATWKTFKAFLPDGLNLPFGIFYIPPL